VPCRATGGVRHNDWHKLYLDTALGNLGFQEPQVVLIEQEACYCAAQAKKLTYDLFINYSLKHKIRFDFLNGIECGNGSCEGGRQSFDYASALTKNERIGGCILGLLTGVYPKELHDCVERHSNMVSVLKEVAERAQQIQTAGDAQNPRGWDSEKIKKLTTFVNFIKSTQRRRRLLPTMYTIMNTINEPNKEVLRA